MHKALQPLEGVFTELANAVQTEVHVCDIGGQWGHLFKRTATAESPVPLYYTLLSAICHKKADKPPK